MVETANKTNNLVVSKKDCSTYLSSRGYIVRKKVLTHDQINDIIRSLTVLPFEAQKYVMEQFGTKPQKFRVFSENAEKMYLPRFWGLKTFGVPEHNELEEKSCDIQVEFCGDLRPQQHTILNEYMPVLQAEGGGILNVGCAVGKTVMALYVVSKMKKKTLVIVHKSFLMDQWVERIQQFLPSARIGIIQGTKVDIEHCDIVIGMLQSISLKTYPVGTFSSFGLTLVDECHHMAAEVFSRAFTKIASQYMMGLSATLDRKDGLRRVFEWYLGRPVTPHIQGNTIGVVHVHMVKFKDPEYQVARYNTRGTINIPCMVNRMVESPLRMKLVLNKVDEMCRDSNRKVLVLSERRGHLSKMQTLLRTQYNRESGMYVGGESQEKLKLAEQKQILLGTYHMIAEGFDLKTLNALVFASPKTDVIQSSGRILRTPPEERPCIPVIIDIWDECVSFEKKGKQRENYYNKTGFTVKHEEYHPLSEPTVSQTSV